MSEARRELGANSRPREAGVCPWWEEGGRRESFIPLPGGAPRAPGPQASLPHGTVRALNPDPTMGTPEDPKWGKVQKKPPKPRGADATEVRERPECLAFQT